MFHYTDTWQASTLCPTSRHLHIWNGLLFILQNPYEKTPSLWSLAWATRLTRAFLTLGSCSFLVSPTRASKLQFICHSSWTTTAWEWLHHTLHLRLTSSQTNHLTAVSECITHQQEAECPFPLLHLGIPYMCSKFYLRSPLLRGLLTTGLLVATSCLIILFMD